MIWRGRGHANFFSWQGNHALSGSTFFNDNPDIPAPGSAVLLLRGTLDTRTIRRTVSDNTALWAFAGIGMPQGEGYLVLALDKTGQYNPAAQADRIPSPMPPDPEEHP